MKPPPPEAGLTFDWPDKSGYPFLLFWCVSGSLLAHAATFFLFQIKDPQRVTIPQPAPHVSLLTASSPENIALLRWIEAEDPALVATDNSIVPPALAQVVYRPSFATPRTPPIGPPEEITAPVRFPPAVDRLTENLPTAPQSPPVPTPSVHTTITLSGALASRYLVNRSSLTPPALAEEPVSSTVFLIGVDERGEVRYSFLQPPVGNPEQASPKLDAWAADEISSIVFAPSEDPITWDFLTFHWGSEVYHPTAP